MTDIKSKTVEVKFKPSKAEAYKLLLDKNWSAGFQEDLKSDMQLEEYEELAIDLAFAIARTTLQQFPEMAKALQKLEASDD